MAAMRRSKIQDRYAAPAETTTGHLAAADSTHREVMSPAMQLQARVGAALASPDSAFAIEPAIDKWPAPIRLTILLGAAAASWLLLWQAAKLLI